VAVKLPFCFLYKRPRNLLLEPWRSTSAKGPRLPLQQDLERLLYIRKYKKPLTDELINTAIAGRDFQLQAIRSVMEGIEGTVACFFL